MADDALGDPPTGGWDALTIEERRKIFNACVLKVGAKNNLPGEDLVKNLLSFNIPGALESWVNMFFTQASSRRDCLKCLPKAEADGISQTWHEDQNGPTPNQRWT